ncbi:hypothetical protein CJU89_6165 [Yarrowia sp. B02]|nr:hypothetical protein CJU89_6165 [Yarrowia sp. B02]
MATVLSELAALLHKIAKEVDAAETDYRLKDVSSALEPTILEFKRLGSKAVLSDIPDQLWKSVSQVIATILTLCEQRGLERERQTWASKWADFRQAYEKGKAALGEERKRVASLTAERDALREELRQEKQKAASAASEESQAMQKEFHAMHMQLMTSANDDKLKAMEQVAELKLSMVSRELDDSRKDALALEAKLAEKDGEMERSKTVSARDLAHVQSQLADAQSKLEEARAQAQVMAQQLEEARAKAKSLQANADEAAQELAARDAHVQQFRRSPCEVNSMSPLGHVQQLHSNVYTPSSGTPPSLFHTMRHTPPSHAHAMQPTPPPHFSSNQYHQSPSVQGPYHQPPSLQGSYHQPPSLQGPYHQSPPPHSQYYQPHSPGNSYHQSPQLGHGSLYGPPAGLGHMFARPQTGGRDGTSRPQTALDPVQGPLEDEVRGLRFSDEMTTTPVMSLRRGESSENDRPSTSHSRSGSTKSRSRRTKDSSSSAKDSSSPVKDSSGPTKENPSPAKTPSSPSKTGATKVSTLRRKFKGLRRPPYGYLSKHAGRSVAEGLDHPLVSGAEFSWASIPMFEDGPLEAMKQALTPTLLAMINDFLRTRVAHACSAADEWDLESEPLPKCCLGLIADLAAELVTPKMSGDSQEDCLASIQAFKSQVDQLLQTKREELVATVTPHFERSNQLLAWFDSLAGELADKAAEFEPESEPEEQDYWSGSDAFREPSPPPEDWAEDCWSDEDEKDSGVYDKKDVLTLTKKVARRRASLQEEHTFDFHCIEHAYEGVTRRAHDLFQTHIRDMVTEHELKTWTLETLVRERNPFFKPENDIETWGDCAMVFVSRNMTTTRNATRSAQKLHLVTSKKQGVADPWTLESRRIMPAKWEKVSSGKDGNVIRYRDKEVTLPPGKWPLRKMCESGPFDRPKPPVVINPSGSVVVRGRNFVGMYPKGTTHWHDALGYKQDEGSLEVGGVYIVRFPYDMGTGQYNLVDNAARDLHEYGRPTDADYDPVAYHSGLLWWHGDREDVVPTFVDLDDPYKLWYRKEKAIKVVKANIRSFRCFPVSWTASLRPSSSPRLPTPSWRLI